VLPAALEGLVQRVGVGSLQSVKKGRKMSAVGAEEQNHEHDRRHQQ
jgi:hypothetical protein